MFNNPIFSSRSLFFSTQLSLKIPTFDLNNPFVFHQTGAVDMQSLLEFLQLIHDFLSSGNKVRCSIYVFLVAFITGVSSWPNCVCTLLQFRSWLKKSEFDSHAVPVVVGINVQCASPIVCPIKEISLSVLFIFMRFEFI